MPTSKVGSQREVEQNVDDVNRYLAETVVMLSIICRALKVVFIDYAKSP